MQTKASVKLLQVVEILKASASSELFNPELETNKGRRGQDLVTKDLLGALLAVSYGRGWGGWDGGGKGREGG